MTTIQDLLVDKSPYQIKVFPVTKVETFLEEVSPLLSKVPIHMSSLFEADCFCTPVIGICVYLEGRLIAFNSIAVEDGLLSSVIGFSCFSDELSSEQITGVIKAVGLPIDWKVPFGTEKSFQTEGDIRFYVNLPDNLDGYVSMLPKKQRTEFRKFYRPSITFSVIPSQEEFDNLSIVDHARLQSLSLGGDFYRIYCRLRHYRKQKGFQLLAVHDGDVLVGYNWAIVENGIMYDLAFTRVLPLEKDGLYFSVMYGLIAYCIENKLYTYDAGFGCMYKRKFVPFLGKTLASLAFCNMVDSDPSIYEDEEFMNGYSMEARLRELGAYNV